MSLPFKYNAAIVGCGRIASDFDDDPLMRKNYGISTHAGGYVDNPNIELIAAADISGEKLKKFGKRWGVYRLYTDYRELLKNEEIAILSICTWNTAHLEILEEAAKRNVKAIFCEKPLSNSLENADRMMKIVSDHNIALFVNHRRRWDGLYEKIREHIKEGHMGSIQQVSCYYTSGIANTCSHLFDVLRMLFGEIKSVCAWHKNDFNKDDPDMDGYIIFQNGVTATLQSLDARYYSLFEFDIYGTVGRLRIEDNGFKISYWSVRDSSESRGYRTLLRDDVPVEVSQKNIMKNAVQNIVECLSSEAVPACTGIDGVKSLEIICAFHASATAGNMPIDLPLKRRDMTIKSK
jgi:predicted dehydrogenase